MNTKKNTGTEQDRIALALLDNGRGHRAGGEIGPGMGSGRGSERNQVKAGCSMKTITLDAETIRQAAREAGTTTEGFVSMIRSVSTGRRIQARHVKTDNGMMTFATK